jgi:hypothetical protein
VRAAAKQLGLAPVSVYKLLKREGISLHQPEGLRNGLGGRIDRVEFKRLAKRYAGRKCPQTSIQASTLTTQISGLVNT